MATLKWKDINKNTSDARLQLFAATRQDAYAILQLKNIPETDSMRFRDYSQLKRQYQKPKAELYNCVYVGRASVEPGREEECLDQLFEKFNIDHPADYRGYSMSVSDIVLLKHEGNVSAWFVDTLGFMTLRDFYDKDNYLRNAEISIEDDYDQIDGVINNGRKNEPQNRESVLQQLKDLKAERSEESLFRQDDKDRF